MTDEQRKPHEIQGSREWHAFRAKHIGASDVPAIMGTCDFRSAYDVFLTKMPDYKPDPDIDCAWPIVRGKSLEPVILAHFEMRHSCSLKQPTIESGIFHASLDGWYEEEGVLVECKAPAIWKHTMALCGLVPDTYVDQVQAQLMVSGSPYAYYVSFHDGEPESHQYAEVKVKRDETRIQQIKDRCAKFWELVQRREWADGF